jgi:hypothetical protein
MQLLNTKTLLVIATLLATIVGLLVRQERREAAEQQRIAVAEKHNQELWQQVKRYQETESSMWGSATEAKKKSPW